MRSSPWGDRKHSMEQHTMEDGPRNKNAIIEIPVAFA